MFVTSSTSRAINASAESLDSKFGLLPNDTSPITARSLQKPYHIKGDEFERAYKEFLSGFRDNKIYHVGDGHTVAMNGFRCYITANKAAAAALAKVRMVHADGSTTALRLVEVGPTADGRQCVYDLQGIEQSANSTQQRGVYIKGGRKYVK